MERKWPRVTKCIEYKCGMLHRYLQKFPWEDVEDDATEYEYSSEEDEHGNIRQYTYKPSQVKSFLHEVRTTRGYDVNTIPPRFMRTPFWRMIPTELLDRKETFDTAIKVAVNHISFKTGKVYRHVHTLKIVDSPHCILHLTFIAQRTAAKFVPDKKEKEQKKIPRKKKEVVTDKKEKERKKKPREKKEVVAAADVGEAETFLATVLSSWGMIPIEDFKVFECFLKPEDDAPWEYINPP